MENKLQPATTAIQNAIKACDILLSSLRLQIETIEEAKRALIEEKSSLTPVGSEDDAKAAFRRSSEFLSPIRKK